MGLDAHVCCECFELGRLRSSSPSGCNLFVEEDGTLSCGSEDLEVQLAFDAWQASLACEHKRGRLVSHRIGNISLVAALRKELEQWPMRFPMLLECVLWSGSHCGDQIPAAKIPKLADEVKELFKVKCSNPENERMMRAFENQMGELVTAAMRVGKPIVF